MAARASAVERRRRRQLPALVVLALVAASPRGAAGEEEERPEVALLGLVVPPGQGALAEALDAALDAAAGPAGLRALGAEELRARRGAAATEAEARAAGLRVEARRHYMDFHFALAAEALESARRALVEVGGDLLGDPAVVETGLELARVYLDLGEPDAAARTLLDLARLDPSVAPDPADFPPALLEAFERARVEATATAAADLLEPVDRLARTARDLSLEVVVTGAIGQGEEGGLVALLRVVDLGRRRIRAVEVPLPEGEDQGSALARALAGALAPRGARRPRSGQPATALFVLTTPPGATVAVDGAHRADATPATIEVAPGLHLLRLTLEGHDASELFVMAWDGQTRPVEVTLARTEPRTLLRAWWLWTLVSLAAAGAAVGIGLWAASAAEDLPDARITIGR